MNIYHLHLQSKSLTNFRELESISSYINDKIEYKMYVRTSLKFLNQFLMKLSDYSVDYTKIDIHEKISDTNDIFKIDIDDSPLYLYVSRHLHQKSKSKKCIYVYGTREEVEEYSKQFMKTRWDWDHRNISKRKKYENKIEITSIVVVDEKEILVESRDNKELLKRQTKLKKEITTLEKQLIETKNILSQLEETIDDTTTIDKFLNDNAVKTVTQVTTNINKCPCGLKYTSNVSPHYRDGYCGMGDGLYSCQKK